MGQSPAGSSMNEQTGMEFHQGKTNFGSVFLNCSKVKTNAPTKIANKDDIVICVRAPVGVVNITNRKICIGRGLAALSPKELVDRDYLFYALQASQKAVEKLAAGSTFSSIPGPELCKLELPKQTYEKQKSIGRALSSADKAIAILEKQISKYENIKKSTINLLLKPKADWIKKTIGDVCSFFTSSSKSAYIDPDGQYFIVDMGAVSDDGTLIAQKRTNYAHDFLHKNDLIMPKDDIGGGNIIGKAVAIQENDKYILSDHVYKLQTELDATFLSYLINSPKINKYMRAMATGSAQLGISKRTISKCELCFPADLGQQKAIAQKLGAIDEHINNLKQQLKKQQDLKQGLMQYFFGD